MACESCATKEEIIRSLYQQLRYQQEEVARLKNQECAKQEPTRQAVDGEAGSFDQSTMNYSSAIHSHAPPVDNMTLEISQVHATPQAPAGLPPTDILCDHVTDGMTTVATGAGLGWCPHHGPPEPMRNFQHYCPQHSPHYPMEHQQPMVLAQQPIFSPPVVTTTSWVDDGKTTSSTVSKGPYENISLSRYLLPELAKMKARTVADKQGHIEVLDDYIRVHAASAKDVQLLSRELTKNMDDFLSSTFKKVCQQKHQAKLRTDKVQIKPTVLRVTEALAGLTDPDQTEVTVSLWEHQKSCTDRLGILKKDGTTKNAFTHTLVTECAGENQPYKCSTCDNQPALVPFWSCTVAELKKALFTAAAPPKMTRRKKRKKTED
eukprot:TRINITY_DN55834_c0_g1_i1.p1 TRINITY_DN55834_c0_g1~~TRINITY_DN55834_c0_g1_i1.p1  ORF type:complete len:376 (-),score=31.45 TRINITY_DN55834_c0_g1_i1:213-1340(-)